MTFPKPTTLLDLASVLEVHSKLSPTYRAYATMCFWYAGSTYDVMQEMCEGVSVDLEGIDQAGKSGSLTLYKSPRAGGRDYKVQGALRKRSISDGKRWQPWRRKTKVQDGDEWVAPRSRHRACFLGRMIGMPEYDELYLRTKMRRDTALARLTEVGPDHQSLVEIFPPVLIIDSHLASKGDGSLGGRH
jgi:hypothetical protein